MAADEKLGPKACKVPRLLPLPDSAPDSLKRTLDVVTKASLGTSQVSKNKSDPQTMRVVLLHEMKRVARLDPVIQERYNQVNLQAENALLARTPEHELVFYVNHFKVPMRCRRKTSPYAVLTQAVL